MCVNIARQFGIHQLPEVLIRYSFVKLGIDAIRILSSNLFLITITLFYLDALSPVQIGLVWGLYYGVQAVFDYPTGNLGDIMGYKRILVMAYIVQLIAIPFLLLANSLSYYIIFMAIFAFGISQESGALEAWYDNTYRRLAKEIDPERTIFTDFQARSGLVYNTMAVTGFVSAGFIGTYISRHAVFIIFLILVVIIFLMILILVPYEKPIGTEKYLTQVRNSFKFYFQDRKIFFYFTGIAIIWSSNSDIWYPFLLFRLYSEYTGSDAGAGILRGIIFFCGLLWNIIMIKIVRFFKKEYLWVFIATLFSNSVFFMLVMIYYYSYPPQGFDIHLLLGFIAIYQIPVILEALQGILDRKIILDLIPDEYRNSLYSLLPTLSRGFGLPFVIITGFLVSNYGLKSSFYWLSFVSFIGSILIGITFLHNEKINSNI